MTIPNKNSVVVDLNDRRREKLIVIKRRTADVIKWRIRQGFHWIVRNAVRFPYLVWSEIKYTFIGLATVFAAWKRWVTVEWQMQALREAQALARRSNLIFDTRQLVVVQQEAKRNAFISLVLFGILCATIVVLLFLYGSYVGYWIISGLILLFDAIGHTKKRKQVTNHAKKPVSPLSAGISLSKLQEDIKHILLTECKPPVEISFHGQNLLPYGVEFDCFTKEQITDKHLSQLTRSLQAGENMISLIRDRRNAATPVLRLFWSDPLEDVVTPPRVEPKSLSCRQPFELTRCDDGKVRRISFYGSHTLILGKTGSGKSNAVWVIEDKLVDCYDADVYGIDVTHGPLFGAYRRVMKGVAYDAEAARVILEDALDEAERRNQILNMGMDADDDGLDDENWIVSDKPGGRAWFIIIDEYTKLAEHDDLRRLCEVLLETTRKAAIYLIISSPSANRRELKSTVPLRQTALKILFNLSFGEITPALGPGSVDDGWRPDRFDVGDPHNVVDEGKAYISGPGHSKPVVHRFHRLTSAEIRERNQLRLQAATTRQQTRHLPRGLNILRHAFEQAGWPDQLATQTIIETVDEDDYDGRALASDLRGTNIQSSTIRIGDRVLRGYRRKDLENELLRFE